MNSESGAATPQSRLKIQSNYRAENALMIASAANRWPEILMAHGISEKYLSGKHSPCPIHGGKDGFRFTDEGKGYGICATCTEGKFKDGFVWIALKNGISNTEAFKRVAQYLDLNAISSLQQDKGKQFSFPTKKPHNQEANKLEEEQRLLTKKRVAGTHAGNILSNCVWKSHSYLQNKGVNQSVLVNKTNYDIHYQKINSHTGKIQNKKQTIYAGALIIPIYDINKHEQLIGAQFINANGSRAYITDTLIVEGIHIIKGNDNLPHVAAVEGYATGLSVFTVTGATVIVTFDANGIESKAERLQASFSSKQLVFFGDNDSHKQFTGNKAAEKAAHKTNGIAVIPPGVGDWNDYHISRGLEATKAEIDKQLEGQKAIKELDMRVANNNVVDLTSKLKLIDDLVPKNKFPYLSEKQNPLNVPENIEFLLNHYEIKARFNLVKKDIDINIPGQRYSKTNEKEVELSYIASLCVKNGVPKVDLSNWLLLIADKYRYSPAVEWINSIQ